MRPRVFTDAALPQREIANPITRIITVLKRPLVVAYGVACYAVFLATFLYAVGFIANVVVPRSIDSPPVGDFTTSVVIDLALLLLFAVQHSGMARGGFKRWITRFIPAAAERSTYVLVASVVLAALFVLWQPLGGVVWSVDAPVARGALYALCAFGWLTVLAATFFINHFDLFGLRQVWLYLRREPYTPVAFKTPGLYRLVRHPLYAGFIFAFWATPDMTVAHLLFALATTGYILIAIQFEERDLLATLGDAYRDYRNRVPMIIPFLRAGRARNPGKARLST